MYHALIDGKDVSTERLQWVKLQPNGVYIHCSEPEGQGVILNDEIYHVSGKPEIDAPTVVIVWQDDVTALVAENELLKECILELSEQIYGGA